MPPGFLTLNTGSTFTEAIDPALTILGATYTPYLDRYMSLVGDIGSREIWFNESLSNDEVTLDAAYTSGSGSMVFTSPTTLNPYKVTENFTRVETEDGSAVWKITAFNTSTNTATIQLEYGSDTSLDDETQLYLTQYDVYGADFGSDNEGDTLQFATSDINYPTFIYQRIKSADGNEEHKLRDVGIYEATIAHQEKKLWAKLRKQLERNLFYSVKFAGTGAGTRQGNTITSGLNSKAAGLATLINGQGGRVADNGSSDPVNEDDIISDVQYMRAAGAFTTMLSMTRNENQMSEVDMYVAEETLGDINKFIRLERDEKALSAQANGVFGSWATRLIANGAYVNVYSSTGVRRNDYFMVPSRATIEHKFIYLFDKIQIAKGGHNTRNMYATGFTSEVPNAFSMVYRKNLARLS